MGILLFTGNGIDITELVLSILKAEIMEENLAPQKLFLLFIGNRIDIPERVLSYLKAEIIEENLATKN